jgi:hypothetical protein
MQLFEGFLILAGRAVLGSALVLSYGAAEASSATVADFTPVSLRQQI